MGAEILDDTEVLRNYLERDPYLHLYALGDLDDRFRARTTWYGWIQSGEVESVVLEYESAPIPTVLALNDRPDPLIRLLDAIAPHLPSRFHAHLSPGVLEGFPGQFTLSTPVEFCRMALYSAPLRSTPLRENGEVGTVILTARDLTELQAFYSETYPGNWFDPELLRTERFTAIRDTTGIAAVAGVHVYSTRFAVAAVGNVATRRDVRNRGYGRAVTADLCTLLLADGLRVGLNVRTDNSAAVAAYRRIGFRENARYLEVDVRRNDGTS